MTIVAPSTITQWHEFLRSYSSEFPDSEFMRSMAADGLADEFLSAAQRRAGWLGYDPASEDQIIAVERRLGVQLPPSYRNFLLTSNGWNTISYAVDLLAADEIGWFPDLEPTLMQAWSETSFEKHFPLLERCLMVSNDDGGSGQYLLLHSADVADNGEWTAFVWWPGDGDDPERYDNFAELIADLWKRAVESDD